MDPLCAGATADLVACYCKCALQLQLQLAESEAICQAHEAGSVADRPETSACAAGDHALEVSWLSLRAFETDATMLFLRVITCETGA